MQLYGNSISSPVGMLTLVANNNALVAILWENQNDKQTIKRFRLPYKIQTDHPIIIQAQEEIKQYFAMERTMFTVPIDISSLHGTEFQKQVWVALQTIPYGTTRSYKDVAIQIGMPTTYRAVGAANKLNPLSIIIPCHRVIGTNGKLTGFNGGIQTKEYLLNHEKVGLN
jgi:methylated-DNA-[protein]-cysteine S-methyltransferase